MRTYIQRLCEEAAALTAKEYGSTDVLYTKSSARDVVTRADLAAHRHCLERIASAYPGHAILSEENETGHDVSGDDLWVIDPLDGSLNFSTRTPLFGTMIAYVRKGEVVLAAICLPILQESYVAEKGAGAFLNGTRIRRSGKTDWAESYGCGIAKHTPSHRPIFERLDADVAHEPFWMNGLGSTAVSAAWTASGRREWCLMTARPAWDTAAPVLLLQEAGCVVTDMHGAPWKYGSQGILAANEALHPKLVQTMKAK